MNREKCAAYFRRMGLELPENPIPNGALLKEIQFAHCTRIAYENLDVLRGIPIELTPDAMFDKIVTQGKGGYCFEVNGALGWLLSQLGYEVTHYFARYLRGETTVPMRRHRVLKVKGVDGTWLCDVGIGEVAPRYPVEFVEGREQPQFDECYRLDRDENLGWVLMDLYQGAWRPFYSFTEEPQLDVDFVATSFYCEKHPDSPFNKAPMLAIKTAEGRVTVDGDLLKIVRGSDVTTAILDTPEKREEAYRTYFFLPGI